MISYVWLIFIFSILTWIQSPNQHDLPLTTWHDLLSYLILTCFQIPNQHNSVRTEIYLDSLHLFTKGNLQPFFYPRWKKEKNFTEIFLSSSSPYLGLSWRSPFSVFDSQIFSNVVKVKSKNSLLNMLSISSRFCNWLDCFQNLFVF